MMVVAPRVTEAFKEVAIQRGGTFVALSAGTWEVRGLGHLLYVIETEEVSDHVLHLFSCSFLRNPFSVLPLLSDAERAMFVELVDEVQQFRRRAWARLRYADCEEVAM